MGQGQGPFLLLPVGKAQPSIAEGVAKSASLGGWKSPLSCQQVVHDRVRAESQEDVLRWDKDKAPSCFCLLA